MNYKSWSVVIARCNRGSRVAFVVGSFSVVLLLLMARRQRKRMVEEPCCWWWWRQHDRRHCGFACDRPLSLSPCFFCVVSSTARPLLAPLSSWCGSLTFVRRPNVSSPSFKQRCNSFRLLVFCWPVFSTEAKFCEDLVRGSVGVVT